MPRTEPAAPPTSLLRITPDEESELVWLLDADGAVVYVGPLCASLLGYAPEELAETRLADLVHPDDAEELRDFLGEAWEGRPQGLAFRTRHRDGGYVWLGSIARAVRDPEGGEARLQLVSRDVTPRKRTEEALKRLSRENQIILDSVADGICGLDLRGNVTFENPAAARILGHEPGELTGKPLHQTIHHSRTDGAPYPWEESPIRATLEQGTVQEVAHDLFWRRDGTAVPVEYVSTPALDEDTIVGAVLTFRDVTARRENEAALRRAEWLAGIGQTVLTLRHEINNPLTSMLADAALLEMGGNTPEEALEMVQSIVRQARRIRDVVLRLAERKDDPALRQVGASRMLDLSDPGEPPAS